MICPICSSELILGPGTKRYETLAEHVQDPNAPSSAKEYFICSNSDCISISKKWFWDHMGDFYGSHGYELQNIVLFYHGITAARQSPARRIHIEVSKEDENFTLLHLGFFKVRVKYSYTADEDGNILKRKPRIEMWRRWKKGWINYIPGIKMFFFCLRQIKQLSMRLRENSSNEYVKMEFLREFNLDQDKRWWKKLYKFVIKIKYKKTKNFILATQYLGG